MRPKVNCLLQTVNYLMPRTTWPRRLNSQQAATMDRSHSAQWHLCTIQKTILTLQRCFWLLVWGSEFQVLNSSFIFFVCVHNMMLLKQLERWNC
jgi:hypothetical protein